MMIRRFKFGWSDLSLTQKSITVGCCLLVGNSLLLAVFFSIVQERDMIDNLKKEGLAIAKAVSEISKYGVLTGNREILEGNIRGMLTESICNIKIMDSTGSLMAEAEGKRLDLHNELTTAGLKLPIPSVQKQEIYDGSGRLKLVIVEQPIETLKVSKWEEIGFALERSDGEKQVIGMVSLIMDTAAVYDRLARNRRIFIGIAAVVILVGIPIIVLFVHVAARPLKRLVTATHKVAEGDMDHKVDISSSDEIGRLAASFNIMLERLKEAREKLVVSERVAASGRLAADVAHEINNPLAIMKNYIYIMIKKKMASDDPNQKYLRIIDGEIERVAKIIRNFNDFYRGAPIDEPAERFDLHVSLLEVIEFCRLDLEDNNIEIDVMLTSCGEVTANRDRIKQVFLNIIKNAKEAMPEGGNLSIKSVKNEEMITVSISDTGTGIDRESIKKIFDPFFSTKGIKGIGLGLSVSYGIIKGYNGEITVKSEPGKGTTFNVSLPPAPDDRPSE